MKKNKNVQYLLLVLVLGIWGTIAFQMCDFLEDSTVTIAETQALPILADNTSKRDSFAILVNYTDPFLGKKITRSKSSRKSQVKRSKYQRPAPPSITKAKPKPMPPINYQGYAINGHRITRVRVSIDKKLYTMKQFKQEKGITILEMYKDSIIIGWKGERKTIIRNK